MTDIDDIAKLLVENLEPETLRSVRRELEQKTDGMDHDSPTVIHTDRLLGAINELSDDCGE
jgi:hypothetical protein